MPVVALRAVDDSDLDDLFRMVTDPESIRMAAFTRDDPADRDKFDREGDTEITYWLDRPFWGHGIASEALRLVLTVVSTRWLHARVASDNAGSRRVLAKAGFREVGPEVSYAPGRGAEIEETVLVLH
jgi:RimJ/RimL family protein N-acetyltransferase